MKYDIIYADPNWAYRDKCHSGKRGAGYKYPVNSTKWIASLPIGNIAAKDCALFLWVTMPLLPDGLMVMKSWGFEFKTTAFVWIKQNKIADSLFMGMGNWTRSNAELCLLGVRGKPKRVDAGVHSVILSHIEGHSKKPDEARGRIVRLMGDLPRVELFARQRAAGWDSIGNEIDGRNIEEVLLAYYEGQGAV